MSKLTLNKLWNGFNWLARGPNEYSSELSGSIEGRGIHLVNVLLSASQEGLCPMDLE
jgi:hypothetical protein